MENVKILGHRLLTLLDALCLLCRTAMPKEFGTSHWVPSMRGLSRDRLVKIVERLTALDMPTIHRCLANYLPSLDNDLQSLLEFRLFVGRNAEVLRDLELEWPGVIQAVSKSLHERLDPFLLAVASGEVTEEMLK